MRWPHGQSPLLLVVGKVSQVSARVSFLGSSLSWSLKCTPACVPCPPSLWPQLSWEQSWEMLLLGTVLWPTPPLVLARSLRLSLRSSLAASADDPWSVTPPGLAFVMGPGRRASRARWGHRRSRGAVTPEPRTSSGSG